MKFLNKLHHQSILSAYTFECLQYLIDGKMSIKQYHNKKSYYKRKGDIIKVIELTVAYEIYKLEVQNEV